MRLTRKTSTTPETIASESKLSRNEVFRPEGEAVARFLLPMDGPTASTLFSQYLEHARHAESQRQTFFQVYLVIIGVGVGALSGSFPGTNALPFVPITVFLALISVFGLLVTYSLNLAYTIYTRQAERIQVCHLDLGAGFVNFYGPGRWPKTGSRLTMMRLYSLAYCIGAGVFTAAAAAGLAEPLPADVFAGGLVYLALWVWFEKYLEPRRQLYHRQFIRDLDEVLAHREATATKVGRRPAAEEITNGNPGSA